MDNNDTSNQDGNPIQQSTGYDREIPSQSRSKNFSAKLIIGIIAFLLLAGGAAAGYVYLEPIMKLVSNPTSSPTPSPNVTFTPTLDPSSLTKYKEDGFELMYSSLWKPKEPFHGGGQKYDFVLQAENESALFFAFGGKAIEPDPISDELRRLKISTWNNVLFNGYDGVSYEEVEELNDKYSRTVLLEDRDKQMVGIITYLAFSKSTYEKYMGEFEKVLSTYKFTESQTLTEKDIEDIKTSLALHEKIGIEKIADFTSELYKDPIYASGNFALKDTPGSGAKWFAQKQNGEWVILYTGNGLPECTEIEKYNAPKEFLNCY